MNVNLLSSEISIMNSHIGDGVLSDECKLTFSTAFFEIKISEDRIRDVMIDAHVDSKD